MNDDLNEYRDPEFDGPREGIGVSGVLIWVVVISLLTWFWYEVFNLLRSWYLGQ